jgi:nucleoside-diphosphate-sugar epimerase
MLDRDESALHGTQLSIYGTALLDSPDVILADIRDAETVNAIFKERRPDVVFHGGTKSLAAADLRNSDDFASWGSLSSSTLHIGLDLTRLGNSR